MSQSLSVTAHHNPFLDGRKPARVVLDWVTATGGTVSLAICSTLTTANLSAAGGNSAAIQPKKIRGNLVKVTTAPGLLGDLTTSLPTSYDLSLLDSYGNDVADGHLGARSAAVAEVVLFDPVELLDTELTVTIANAGDGTKGRIIIDLAEAEGGQ